MEYEKMLTEFKDWVELGLPGYTINSPEILEGERQSLIAYKIIERLESQITTLTKERDEAVKGRKEAEKKLTGYATMYCASGEATYPQED